METVSQILSPAKSVNGQSIKRNKVAVFISGIIFYRNFITSGALDELKKECDVEICLGDPNLERFGFPDGLRYRGLFPVNNRRSKIRFKVQEFVMAGLKNKCHTFKIKQYRLGMIKRFLYSVLANPLTVRWMQKISEKILGSDPKIDQYISDLNPNWVIIPSSCEDSVTADIIKTCQKNNIKSFVLVNGWDNLSSKGTIPVEPDLLGVWGEQAKNDALFIHGLDKNQIRIMGAPHFDHYFGGKENKNKNKIKKIYESNNLPKGKKIILFGGCLQPFDEITVLRKLERSIISGELPNCHVLFRPHPWRHPRKKEDHFEPSEYKHVSLDSQVGETFLKIKKSGKAADSKKVFPDLDYYPSLFKMADFTISPLSTFVIESLLMGKKTLALCYSDGIHYFSADKVSQYDHVQYLKDAPGMTFCYSPENLIQSCKNVLNQRIEDSFEQSIKDFLKFIVYSDEQNYAKRLVKIINSES